MISTLSSKRQNAHKANPFKIYGTPVPKRRQKQAKRSPGAAVRKKGQPSILVRGLRLLPGAAVLLLLLTVAGWLVLPLAVKERLAVWADAAIQAPGAKDGYTTPVRYAYISSPYGKRWGRMHQGIDLAAAQGEPVYALAGGKVVYSGWEPGYGNSVVIEHGNGMQTRYAHCSRVLVKAGASVFKGAVGARIGSTGHSTGPHLHLEVIVDGLRRNPEWYYKFDKDALPGSEQPADSLIGLVRDSLQGFLASI
jgi:murein DD-endopeptidase MepM/ murein hydrolase activator NlpD